MTNILSEINENMTRVTNYDVTRDFINTLKLTIPLPPMVATYQGLITQGKTHPGLGESGGLLR